MPKRFNTTGVCVPEKHYMVDISQKLDAIFALVEDGSYFVINRPRQYGKTTVLSLLEQRLHQHPDYLPLFISFEGFDTESYQDAQHFLRALVDEFRVVFKFLGRDDLLNLLDQGQAMTTLHQFGAWISEVVTTIRQRLVLMIDEVDKSSNHQLFLDFLAVLRTKYLWMARGKDVTFHSVILAGVHDVKTLKLKMRPDDRQQYNSPWNIAIDFPVDLSFSPTEIQTMLAEYVEATGVTMDQAEIADRLYYYTSGYPFLVSALCQIIDKDLPKEDPHWQVEHVEEAVNRLLAQSNTNFEHLIKTLENHQEFSELVEQLVVFDKPITYNQDSPLIHLGLLHGVFTCRHDQVAIHNRLYQERIYNYLTSKLEVASLVHTALDTYTFQQQYLLPDSTLAIEHVVLKFQEFMKQEYSPRDTAFLERNGRLIFFAFLRPILNGRGYAFKEPQVSEEKRLDVLITYGARKYLIELKIWRGEQKHQEGLRQLSDYLERIGLETGYLIIFDFTRKGQKTWKQERIQFEQKSIFAVWV